MLSLESGRRNLKAKVILELSDLGSDVQCVINEMVEEGVDISCLNISDYWMGDWKQCPLCGEPVGESGYIVHKHEH